ncbi:MAG: Tetratricopeptide 1 repeat-containing protein [Flavipsychrobacter sp.]|jgi:tetratricopeptide (TPR) repeat protein|nr:Tetratricopeptide 1 repeat-containing protein [Flavipsychrobacter sp.]
MSINITLEKIQKLIEEEKYAEVINLLDDKIVSNNSELSNERARALTKLLKFQEALTEFDRTIRLNPSYPNAYASRSEVWYKTKMYEKAIDDCNTALKFDPNYYKAYDNIALILIAQNKYTEALENINKSLRINPKYYVSYNIRARIFYDIRDYKNAINDCNTSLRLKPNNAEAYNILGLVYSAEKNLDAALNFLNKSIEVRPNNSSAYNNRLKVWSLLKNYENAFLDANKAIELRPDIASHYNNRANIFADTKQFDKAFADYTTAIQIDPQYFIAYHNRGNLYYQLKRFKDALTDFDTAYKIHQDPRIKLSIDRTKANLGQPVVKGTDTPTHPFYLFIEGIEDLEKNDQNRITQRIDDVFTFFDKIRIHAANGIEDFVAHYTTLKVADLIVTVDNSRLHYYNAVYMNDPEEGQTLINALGSSAISEAFKRIAKVEENNVYIGSFLPSVHHEDELVMWRTYGKDEFKNDAAGCSIVLDINFFDSDRSYFNTEIRDPSIITSQSLYQVLYFNKRTKKISNDIDNKIANDLDSLKQSLLDLLSLRDKVVDSKKNLKIDKIIYLVVSELRYLFKSADYAFENELRVIEFAPPENNKVQIDHNDNRIPKRVYIESTKLVQPYIKKIVLGPKVPHQNQWTYLDVIMRKKGYKIELRPSICKFQ